MNRIDALFAKAQSAGKTALIPFLTAGDPDLAVTKELALEFSRAAARLGVPLILEIGFPYSDPIADGATIQASYTRALARGVKVADIFATVADLRRQCETPLVAMVSYSLVFRAGAKSFLQRARAAGFDGAIIPDLPAEEADPIARCAVELDFALIQLIAPTTTDERAVRILQATTGFVYCVSVTGITGERDSLPAELSTRIATLRARTALPVCVGFGISKPAQIAALRGQADGVIVGSAIVGRLEKIAPGDHAAIAKLVAFVAELMTPLQ